MDDVQIEIEQRVDARPEVVFPYFTDPARYARWMGVGCELDARPGGIYRVETPQGGVALGEFVEVDPPKRVVFTWGWEGSPDIPPGSSRVEVTLEPVLDHTIVRLVHAGLPVETLGMHREGWARYVGRLRRAASGDDPGPDAAEGR